MTKRVAADRPVRSGGQGVGLGGGEFSESEAREAASTNFDSLFEFLPIGAYRSSPAGKQLRANPAQVRLNGYSSEAEMLEGVLDIGKEWYVDPDRRRQFWALLERDGFVRSFESEIYRHKTRERIWITENAHLVRDQAGRILFCEGTTEEITERVMAQDALRQRERELRQIINLVPQYIFAKDAQGRILLANQAFASILGLPIEQILGRRFERFNKSELQVRLFGMTDRQAIESGTSLQNPEYEVFDAKGQRHLLRTSKIPLTFGGTDALLSVSVDITELRRAEQEAMRSRHDFERMFEASPLPVAVTELDDGRYVAVNAAYVALTGWSRDELLGRTTLERGIWSDRQQRQDMTAQLVQSRRMSNYELAMRDRSGRNLTVLVNGEVFEMDGKPRILSVLLDISARKRAELDLRTANQYLSAVIESCPLPIYTRDCDGLVTSWNPAAEAVFGWSAVEAIGFPLRAVTPDQASESDDLRRRVLAGETLATADIQRTRKDGTVIDLASSMAPLRDGAGAIYGYLTISRDVTEIKRSEALIWQQANFDTLTGLPNRRMLRDRLAQGMLASRRDGLALAVLFIDLDHFKEINDTLGHERGDALLIEAARRIRGCVRESDTVARLGGDEFTVLLPEVRDTSRVEEIAQNILAVLGQAFKLGTEQSFVTASIGVAQYPDDAGEVEDLFKHADQAMYAAKAAGRNCLRYFTPALQLAAQARMRLAGDLRGAAAAGQLHLHYQPVVELASGEVHRAEALVRWQHPTRGLVGPQEFIPVAESTGTIVEIGDWVFHQAVQQVGRWRAQHDPRFQISVNKSPVQFHRAGTAQRDWIERLQQLGLPGDCLVVEITEGLLLDERIDVKAQLQELRAAGIAVSMDDFGTGYSSLAYLQKYDIDYLKIDRSFVRNLTPGSKDRTLCKAIIAMAQALGLKVIAEGVETIEQRDWLKEAGCDYGQGYLFAEPMAVEAFEAWLVLRRG
jgi:diguanylate cyclase (GGDEF)-like protein/PAS domain S-box-containing protein